jgi:outer membrane protein assembly factor BamD
MRKSTLIIAFLLIGVYATEAQAPWIWTPQSRRWVNPKYAAKDSPRAQMDWAVNFFEQRNYERAAKEFARLVRAFPKSELAPEAQYLAGITYELLGRMGEATAAYKKLVEIYPFSARFKDGIEREFSIAESFYAGVKMKLIGPLKVPALDKAIEIYQHVVAQAPYGEYGARAQFRLGESFLRQQRFGEAHRAFQKVVDDYPASPLLEQAKFNVAFCARQLSLKPSYDQSATEEAIHWYETFIASHPESDLIPQAQESLKQLKSFKAQGLAQAAEFYEKSGKRSSAALYYRRIVEEYPDSPQAVKAVAKLSELEKSGALQE